MKELTQIASKYSSGWIKYKLRKPKQEEISGKIEIQSLKYKGFEGFGTIKTGSLVLALMNGDKAVGVINMIDRGKNFEIQQLGIDKSNKRKGLSYLLMLAAGKKAAKHNMGLEGSALFEAEEMKLYSRMAEKSNVKLKDQKSGQQVSAEEVSSISKITCGIFFDEFTKSMDSFNEWMGESLPKS